MWTDSKFGRKENKNTQANSKSYNKFGLSEKMLLNVCQILEFSFRHFDQMFENLCSRNTK